MEKRTIIHEDLCIGCGQCTRDCVGCCIEIVNGKARVMQDICVGCGHCYAICPKNAVEMQGWGEGGGGAGLRAGRSRGAARHDEKPPQYPSVPEQGG